MAESFVKPFCHETDGWLNKEVEGISQEVGARVSALSVSSSLVRLAPTSLMLIVKKVPGSGGHGIELTFHSVNGGRFLNNSVIY